MENIRWDQYNYCKVSKTLNGDPKRKSKEFPYSVTMVKSSGNESTWFSPNYIRSNWHLTNEYYTIRNKAVSKVEKELTVISNLFEAIYERQEAYKMMYSAGKELMRFLKNWRKPKYWKSLKAGAQPDSLPQAWLAYNFGIKPLIQSIDDALHLLGSEFPVTMVRGASGGKIPFMSSYSPGWNSTFYFTTEFTYMAQYRAYVVPKSNPNSALLNVVGLTSPLSTIYSVIPWGWAVDYFANVSELLSNFDNKFPGVDIQRVCLTEFIKGSYRQTTRYINYTPYKWTFNNGEIVLLDRSMNAPLRYSPVWSFPMIGDNQAANLFSAIALTLKGKNK